MDGRRRLLLDIFGSLLGGLLLVIAIGAAANYLQDGMEQARESERIIEALEVAVEEPQTVEDAAPDSAESQEGANDEQQ
jgi:hypothetical protein